MELTQQDKEILDKYKFGNKGLSHKKFKHISDTDYQYLINRFIDTFNPEEAWYRLKLKIDIKPQCELPGCNCFCEFTKMKFDDTGNPTIYNKYCCYEHSRLATGSKVQDKLSNINRDPNVQFVITDEYIKSIIVYTDDKKINWFELQKIPENVYNYIMQRYDDSESFEESLIRILTNTVNRPICELTNCYRPVKFSGYDFKNGICKFTKCCCTEHSTILGLQIKKDKCLEKSNGKYCHSMQFPENKAKLKLTLSKKTIEEKEESNRKRKETRSTWSNKYKQEIQCKKEETCLNKVTIYLLTTNFS